ncbi:hypothetical protein GQ602_002575 [Ophiocordyceps camponoti-floridani]|uniref:NAD dependent epimerase/dehydratase n=1 Tax=Ophiocordyceps camponoti-floridani TaxID=2030778 RepID=A0A8H4QAP7_9HYPO|nr:hypothetical protein GQ602_002575 [Ophiocordyceps camponoti-floridani]
MDKAAKPRQIQVLALGLPRTGTYSMSQALLRLGYHRPFHGIDVGMNQKIWDKFDEATDASFPTVESYHGRPFTRAQWDEIFGESEAVTDLGALFAPQLIEAYPEAYVILAIRDFEPWMRSMNGLLGLMWSPFASFTVRFVDPLLGNTIGLKIRKLLLGFFEAKDVDEARRNAQRIYHRHHEQIRKMVAPDRLLEYRMGSGWEPICSFLNKPVPDDDFPWVNDSEALAALFWRAQRSSFVAFTKFCLPWVGAICAAGTSFLLARRMHLFDGLPSIV